jgi:predicted nuclease with TOPRIM domain
MDANQPVTIDQGLELLKQWAYTLLTLTGIGAILTFAGKQFVVRYFKSKDKGDEIHETNQSKQIDADTQFRADLIKRVETLERELKEMQKEQVSQARRDATLTTQNEHLEKENARQAGEITDLKTRNRELNDKVTVLTSTVGQLASRLSELTGQPIEVKLVDQPLEVKEK